MIMLDGRSSFAHNLDNFLSREFAAEDAWIRDKLRRDYLGTKTDAELANLLVATAGELRSQREDVERYYNGGNHDAWRQNEGVLNSLTERVALYAEVAALRFVDGKDAHADLRPVIEKIRQGLPAGQDEDGVAVARTLDGMYPNLSAAPR